MSKHFRVSSHLPRKLATLGLDLTQILSAAGLQVKLFDQSKVLVTTEELFALWKAIARVSQDPGIGLKLGDEAGFERYDAVAIAAVCSRDLAEALNQLALYKQISCPEEILIQKSAEEWSVQFRWTLASEPEPEALIDNCFAWVLAIARRGTGEAVSPVRIELVQPRADLRSLERHFGCSVLTGADRNALVFSSQDLLKPFHTYSEELLSLVSPKLQEELKRQNEDQTFPEKVRAVIQRRLPGQRPKVQDVARELHLSSRTLQRRLQEHGYSFQQALEEARHELARHYLVHSPLELNETAYLLGYEDANSFVRAFRGWEGVPPAHWREAQKVKVLQ